MRIEKPSPFCPTDCRWVGVPKVCDTDCNHSRDRVFRSPQNISIKRNWGDENKKIVGRNGDYLYLDDKSSINIKSPLIKD